MQSRLAVFSGSSNPLLARKVCSYLGVSLGKGIVGRFSDGEVRVEIHENVRGRDVFALQATCCPVNANLVELMVMVDALKRASARRITVVIPYYGYGRQDQKQKPRVSLTARMIADLLVVSGVSRVIVIDLHSEQIEGFFDVPVDHLSAMGVLLQDLRTGLVGDEIVIAPDAGGVERARDFAKQLRADLAIMDNRGGKSSPCSRVVGDVRGRRAIILDDMVDTGKTIARAAEAVKAAGAAIVDAYCVHAVLSGDAVKDLESSPLRALTITDTIPASSGASVSTKIRTVSIAPMLAEVIRRVHCEESVSSLF